MYPLTGDALYACIYSVSTFGTQGGFVCDAASRVLNTHGVAWRNLYAVGTSAVSILNGRYPSHGLAIGTGLVFGYLAGLHATGNLARLAATGGPRAWRGAPGDRRDRQVHT
jgi:succinate dehydrogenase/fumarate reductase flavoprotein subunit